MLLRLYATAFVNRFAEHASGAGDDTLERALLTTGMALAATKPRRMLGVGLIAAGGVLAWRRRRGQRRI